MGSSAISLRDIDATKTRRRAEALTEDQVYQTLEYYYRRDGRQLTAMEMSGILQAPTTRIEDLLSVLREAKRIIKVDSAGRHIPVGGEIASAVTVTRIEPEKGREDVTRARKLPEDEQLYAEVLERQQQGKPYARYIADKYGVKPDWVMGAMYRINKERKKKAAAAAALQEEKTAMQTETRETTPPVPAVGIEDPTAVTFREKLRTIRIVRKLMPLIDNDVVLVQVVDAVADVLREEGVAQGVLLW